MCMRAVNANNYLGKRTRRRDTMNTLSPCIDTPSALALSRRLYYRDRLLHDQSAYVCFVRGSHRGGRVQRGSFYLGM